MAIVPCKDGVFTGLGSTGVGTDRGLAYLLLRDGRHMLAGHNFEIPAEPEQVEKIHRFSADLKQALGLDPS
ncbi:MAG TPA: hypothetical protein VKU19_38315 [Bryobacteraceae bacterium]|nr:hypothetical protein [Bryobacteraceae bacterium]